MNESQAKKGAELIRMLTGDDWEVRPAPLWMPNGFSLYSSNGRLDAVEEVSGMVEWELNQS